MTLGICPDHTLAAYNAAQLVAVKIVLCFVVLQRQHLKHCM